MEYLAFLRGHTKKCDQCDQCVQCDLPPARRLCVAGPADRATHRRRAGGAGGLRMYAGGPAGGVLTIMT